MNESRHYSEEERARAVGLAVSVGDREAARQLGIPRRTVSHWHRSAAHGGRLSAVVVASRASMLDTLKNAAAEGATSLLEIIRSPTSSDRDKVRAAEVAIDRYQLLSGGPTDRTESVALSMDERVAFKAFIDSLDRAIATDDLDTGRRQVMEMVAASRLMTPLLDSGLDREAAIATLQERGQVDADGHVIRASEEQP
jgi:transposase-like protein